MPSNGLLYPPASVEDIPFVTRPISEGGVLERKGMVEVISSLEAERPPDPVRHPHGRVGHGRRRDRVHPNCFEEYNAHTDPSGRYFTLYKRWHLIGLEVGMSVASVALRGEATGVATCWNADVVATAKRDLKPGELLDGEGGYTVWGKLLPADDVDAHGRPAARPGARRQGRAAGEEGPEPVVERRGDGHVDAARTGCGARWRRCSRAPLPEDGVIDLVFRDALVVDGTRRASRSAATSPSPPAGSSRVGAAPRRRRRDARSTPTASR